MLKKKLLALRCALIICFLPACGKFNKGVESIDASLNEVNGQQVLSVSTELALGGIGLPLMSAPIYLPGKGVVGDLTMGGSLLTLNLSLFDALGVNSELVFLPNGGQVPFIAENEAIMLNVGQTAISVYLLVSQNTVVLGVAIPVKQLDGVGSSIGYSSLFPIFPLNKFQVSAGLFTHANAGENGIGAFFDLSPLMENLWGGKKMILAEGSSPDISFEQIEQRNSAQKRSLDRTLYYLSRDRVTVDLH
jgi:hypothetical protein